MRTLTLAATLFAVTTIGAAAQQAGTRAAPVAGDPITAASIADVAEMVRVADAIDAAVDNKDWALARSFFTDTIDVDFTSLTGGAPARIPADGLIRGWSTNLTAQKTSFHLRGNHQVSFDGPDAATMRSHGYAWNRMEAGALPENGGDPLWEVWGVYEHRFSRSAGAWRVSGMTFRATAQRGNTYVRDTVPGS